MALQNPNSETFEHVVCHMLHIRFQAMLDFCPDQFGILPLTYCLLARVARYRQDADRSLLPTDAIYIPAGYSTRTSPFVSPLQIHGQNVVYLSIRDFPNDFSVSSYVKIGITDDGFESKLQDITEHMENSRIDLIDKRSIHGIQHINTL